MLHSGDLGKLRVCWTCSVVKPVTLPDSPAHWWNLLEWCTIKLKNNHHNNCILWYTVYINVLVQRISISDTAISTSHQCLKDCATAFSRRLKEARFNIPTPCCFHRWTRNVNKAQRLGSKHLSFTMEEVVHEFTLVDLAQDGAHEASRYIIYIYMYDICVYIYRYKSYIIIYYHILLSYNNHIICEIPLLSHGLWVIKLGWWGMGLLKFNFAKHLWPRNRMQQLKVPSGYD